MPSEFFIVDVSRTVGIPIGERVILFVPPMDWQVGGTGTNVPATKYNWRLRAETITPAQVERWYVGEILATKDAIASGFEDAVLLDSTGSIIPPYITSLGAAWTRDTPGHFLRFSWRHAWPIKYFHGMGANAVQLKTGEGMLDRLVIGVGGAGADKVSLYDSVGTTTNPIYVSTLEKAAGPFGTHELYAPFTNGLYVVGTGSSGEWTIVYE